MRIEDRLRRHDERQRMLKQRAGKEAGVGNLYQEELEAQRKRRTLEAALAKVRAQAREAEDEAATAQNDRANAGSRPGGAGQVSARRNRNVEIEHARVHARWESDRRKALAARAHAAPGGARAGTGFEQPALRRYGKTGFCKSASALTWRANPAQAAPIGMELPMHAWCRGKLGRGWEQAREQREQLQERRRAEQELSARLDRRSKSRAGYDADGAWRKGYAMPDNESWRCRSTP